MTRDQLFELWRANEPLALPYFDGVEVELFFDDVAHLEEVADVVLSFLQLTLIDRVKDTRHAYSYFRDVTDEIGFEWAADGLEELGDQRERIWEFVHPTTLSAGKSWEVGDREAEQAYVDIEANCGWEMEHGLQMSWRNGTQLVKLSPYNGHYTNGHAYSDLSNDAFVYSARNPRWNSRPGI